MPLSGKCSLFLFLVATAANAATLSWTGAVNNLWSVGGNWSTGTPPVTGDALVFPGASNRNMNNDLPAGLELQSLWFPSESDSANYSLSGNGIKLSGGWTSMCCPPITVSAPITLTSSQTFSAGGITNFAGPIDLNGFTLTLSPYVTTISGSLIGSGAWIITGSGGVYLSGSSTFSGTINVMGMLNVGGTITNSVITANGGGVRGNGTIPATSLIDAQLSVSSDSGAGLLGDPHTTGILSTGNLSVQGGFVYIDLKTPTPGSGHDQIKTTGTVTLINPTLTVSLPSAIPIPGQSFVIIDNDGIDPITGTFKDLPEGSVVIVGTTPFQITYLGGTGNDVVLTAIAAVPAIGDIGLLLLVATMMVVGIRTLGRQG